MNNNMDTVKSKDCSSFYAFVLGYDGDNSDDDVMISDSDSFSDCDSDDSSEPLDDHNETKTPPLIEKVGSLMLNCTHELPTSTSSRRTPAFTDLRFPGYPLSTSSRVVQNQVLPTPEERDNIMKISTSCPLVDPAQLPSVKDLTKDQPDSMKQSIRKLPEIKASVAGSNVDVCSTIDAISLTSEKVTDCGTVSVFTSNGSAFKNPTSTTTSSGKKIYKCNKLNNNEQTDLHTVSEQLNAEHGFHIKTVVNTTNSPRCKSSKTVFTGSNSKPVSLSEPNQSSSRIGTEKLDVHQVKRHVDNLTVSKKPPIDVRKFHSSCKIIPTESGDIVDFSKFLWPTQDKHYTDTCAEIDDRLQTRIRVRRIVNFSKPALIAFEPPPLYKIHFHGHTKDPRVIKSTQPFSQRRIGRESNDTKHEHNLPFCDKGYASKNSNNYQRNSPQKGLFAKFMPLSDHTSPNTASANIVNKSKCSGIAKKIGSNTTEKKNNLCASNRNLILWNNSSPLFDRLLAKSQKVSTSTSLSCDKPSDNSRAGLLEYQRNTLHRNKTGAKFEKMLEELTPHKQGRRKSEGLQKRSLPKGHDLISNKKIKRHKLGKKADRCSEARKHSGHMAKDGFQFENVSQDQDRSRLKHIAQRNCRKAKRNVLDYHLCSVCMLDKTVGNLKHPAEKIKSSACLKCNKKLNPRDLRCTFCKQCFPNVLTYAGHCYNLAMFHPPLKDVNDYVCTTCRRVFPTRIQFHTHISQSRCARICLPCESFFSSRKSKQEHECEAE